MDLPRDPHDALKLANDTVGVRVWGPATQPTLSLGKADIWDRRWFGERQPLITLARMRELAMADRLSEVAPEVNRTAYDLYGRYAFPCPKPGAQLILGTPFGQRATIEPDGEVGARLVVEGGGKRLSALIWVALARPLVVIECEADGLAPGDVWARVYRHTDTILPGEPVDEVNVARPPADDFDPLPPPCPWRAKDNWGVEQRFCPDSTFPEGFRFVAAARGLGVGASIELSGDQKGLGTLLWAEKEGRINHGVVKRYAPINQAPGAAATATFDAIPQRFALLGTITTSQDEPDAASGAAWGLNEAAEMGLEGLREEQARVAERSTRSEPARGSVDGETVAAAPALVLPKLRRSDGFYGDIPFCSVGSTKLCFQDAALWHADFHLNEIRAASMLTLGQFEETLPYCDMIRTLLDQACENARDTYDLPGAMYPLVHFPLRRRGVTHVNLTWEQDMGLNGLVAKPLWLAYRYSGDKQFLEQTAWPVLSQCARFCAAYATEGEDGRLHIVPTVSPEHWGLTANFERNRDCTSALTLTRYLLLAAAEAAEILAEADGETASWRAAAQRLAPYPTFETDGGAIWTDVLGAPPIEYNIPVPLTPVMWGDDVGLDSPAPVLEIAHRTLKHINVWAPHRGYLNGHIRPRLGVWEIGAKVGTENLLQSYQSIRLFPAVPPDCEIVMEHFAAEGGFNVSAVRTREGRTRDVRIRSVLGGACRVANPWPDEGVLVTGEGGREIARTQGPETHVAFATRPGEQYRLAPVGDTD